MGSINFGQYDRDILTTDAEETDFSEVDTSEVETVVEMESEESEALTTDQEYEIPDQIYERLPAARSPSKRPRVVFLKKEKKPTFWLRKDFARLLQRVTQWLATFTLATIAVPLLLAIFAVSTGIFLSQRGSLLTIGGGGVPPTASDGKPSWGNHSGHRSLFHWLSSVSRSSHLVDPQLDFPSYPPETIQNHLSKLEELQKALLSKSSGLEILEILQSNEESVRRNLEELVATSIGEEWETALQRFRKVYEETSVNVIDLVAQKDGILSQIVKVLDWATQDLAVIDDEGLTVTTLFINTFYWKPAEILGLLPEKNVRARNRFIKVINDIDSYITRTLQSLDSNTDSFKRLQKFIEHLPPTVEGERMRKHISKASEDAGLLTVLVDAITKPFSEVSNIHGLVEACVAYIADLEILLGINEHARDELGWLRESLNGYKNELSGIPVVAQTWEVYDSEFWSKRAKHAVEALESMNRATNIARRSKAEKN